MRTKTEKAINLFESGCLKEALSIFRTFRIGFTKEERRTLQIASESLAGNENFYQQIDLSVNNTRVVFLSDLQDSTPLETDYCRVHQPLS